MTAIKALPPTSEEIEIAINQILGYGDKTAICKLTQYKESTFNRWLNPYDDEQHQSPHYRTLFIQWALDHTNKVKGDELWNLLTTRRALWRESLNGSADGENVTSSRIQSFLSNTALELHMIEASKDGQISKDEAREALRLLLEVEGALSGFKKALFKIYNEENEKQIEPQNGKPQVETRKLFKTVK